MRRFGLIAAPVVAAAALLVAGCANYTEKTVSPLPKTVEGKAQPAPTTTAATTTTAPAATTAAGGAGDPVAGKTVFLTAGCAACHTLADAGSSGTVGPNLDTAKPALALVLDRVTNGKGGMPPFKGQLKDQQIQDVAAYVVHATSGG